MSLKLMMDEALTSRIVLTPCVPIEFDFVLDVNSHIQAINAMRLEPCHEAGTTAGSAFATADER